jgi:hypothetical protein
MAKKLKKFLKKAGKAAAVAAALYGATKLGGRKKSGISVEGARGANLRGKLRAAMPDHLTSDLGASTYVTPESLMPNDPGRYVYPNVYKGGGIAKRGMGAAFKKGGRVKSMGIAKRGGGVAKR